MYGRITLQYDNKESGVGDSLDIDTRIGRIHIETTVETTNIIIEGWDGSTVLEYYYENRDFPTEPFVGANKDINTSEHENMGV